MALTKRAPITNLKALEPSDDVRPGTFEAQIAPFDVVDAYGEVVLKGAFAESFASDWPKLIWSHSWTQPPIGVTLDLKEIDRGVYAKGRLFVDVENGEDNALARQVWTAMKALDGNGDPGVDEFSYFYDLLDGGMATRDGDDVYEIRKARMWEWGPCFKGVNPDTELLTVKAIDERRAAGAPDYHPERIAQVKTLLPDSTPQPTAADQAAQEAAAREHRKALVDAFYGG